MSDLATFERLILSQKPAAEPWKPVTPYDFVARRPSEEPQAELIANVFHPSVVLDAGCGYGHLLLLLRERGIKVYGFDLEKRWPEELSKKCWRADLASPGLTLNGSPSPDVVICRETLEHLTVRQIAQAVRNLVRLTKRWIYLTTRFHPNPKSLLDVATSDDLDPTHISMLNQDFLRMLFVLEGCRRCVGLENTMDWRGLGRVLVYEKL